jgi:hypothetical protein
MKILILLFLFLFKINCKPSSTESDSSGPNKFEIITMTETESIGYTVEKIPVYNDYRRSFTNQSLSNNEKVNVIRFLKIKNLGITTDWIKIERKGVIGYIKGSHLLQQEFSVFNQLKEERKGIITASVLRLREYPHLNARIITQIQGGEIVNILQEGITLQKIHGKTDKWVQVRTEEGKIGFSFNGFIQTIYEKNEIQPNSGYIELIAEKMNYWEQPGKKLIRETVENNQDDICRLPLAVYPRKGEILKVSESVNINSKTYYLMNHSDPKPYCDSACPCGQSDFEKTWFSEDQVKTISETEITNYSLSKYENEKHHELLIEYAKMRNNSVNFTRVEVKEQTIKLSTDVIFEYYEVRDRFSNSVNIFSKQMNQYKLILEGHLCNRYDYYDFNSDGIPEIIETSGGETYEINNKKIFYLKNNNYEEIFKYSIYYDDWESKKDEFQNSTIILSHFKNRKNKDLTPSDKKDLESKEIYTFKKGEFKLTKKISFKK